MQGLGNLLTRAMERHGITQQVTATMIVQRANELLHDMAHGPLATDVLVAYYRNNELMLSCRHSAASYDIQVFLPQLKDQLERHFPDKTFSRIMTRISTAEWYTTDNV